MAIQALLTLLALCFARLIPSYHFYDALYCNHVYSSWFLLHAMFYRIATPLHVIFLLLGVSAYNIPDSFLNSCLSFKPPQESLPQ
jgi:hypothetical protein